MKPTREKAEQILWDLILHSHPNHWTVQDTLNALGFKEETLNKNLPLLKPELLSMGYDPNKGN